MAGKSLLFHFSLESADHKEKVEQKRPATGAAEDVGNGWIGCNAEKDAEDVEEKADSSDDDPGHHEADILLKYKLSKNGQEYSKMWCRVVQENFANEIKTHRSSGMEKAG